MLDFIRLVAKGASDTGTLYDVANALVAKWTEEPIKTLFCPWVECQYSWCSDQPPENWEYCPRCKASFSFNKPTVK